MSFEIKFALVDSIRVTKANDDLEKFVITALKQNLSLTTGGETSQYKLVSFEIMESGKRDEVILKLNLLSSMSA